MIANPEQIGARGGGFALNKGVSTEVIVTKAEEKHVRVFINGKCSPEAETSKSVVELLTAKLSEDYEIKIRHCVEVPIGAGFGSSAAGALGAALALNKALSLHLTYNQLGTLAHIAEVKCRTGLGTVGPLMFGGCGLTIEPGAPGLSHLDRIPVSPDHRIIAGTFRPYATRKLLASQERRKKINECGRKTLRKILTKPSLENFMVACKQFAVGTGFVTKRVQNLMELSEKAGAIGAAQNMLGEAVHALVTVDKMESVHDAFRKLLPEEKIIMGKIDLHGARIR
jgi:pantoate kinase